MENAPLIESLSADTRRATQLPSEADAIDFFLRFDVTRFQSSFLQEFKAHPEEQGKYLALFEFFGKANYVAHGESNETRYRAMRSVYYSVVQELFEDTVMDQTIANLNTLTATSDAIDGRYYLLTTFADYKRYLDNTAVVDVDSRLQRFLEKIDINAWEKSTYDIELFRLYYGLTLDVPTIRDNVHRKLESFFGEDGLDRLNALELAAYALENDVAFAEREYEVGQKQNEYFDFELPEFGRKAQELIDEIFGSGIAGVRVFRIWHTTLADGSHDVTKSISSSGALNLAAIVKLERAYPGACKRIAASYDLFDFREITDVNIDIIDPEGDQYKRFKGLFEQWNAYPVNFETFLRVIRLSNRESSIPSMMQRSLETMEYLESQEPGICAVLHERYGIFNYGRFNKNRFLRQYRTRDDVCERVLMLTTDDWNGALDEKDSLGKNVGVTESIDTQLSDRGIQLTIIEAFSATQLKVLKNRNIVFTPNQKFFGGVIDGHGGLLQDGTARITLARPTFMSLPAEIFILGADWGSKENPLTEEFNIRTCYKFFLLRA